MTKDIFIFFDNVPCFTKQALRMYFQGSEDALNERIKRALKKKRILELKKGLYTTEIYYLQESEKTKFKEFVASKLRFPSYLSLEYVLAKYNLLTEAVYPITSITIKTPRLYQNFLGTYPYTNLKKELYFGFQRINFYQNEYYSATKAKAMFDFLYLKKNLGDLKEEILDGLRINWDNFSQKDFNLFKGYVLKSKSKKMLKILKIMERELYQ